MSDAKKPEELKDDEIEGVIGAGDGLSILTTNLKADLDAAEGGNDSIWLDLGTPILGTLPASDGSDGGQPIVIGRLYNSGS